MSLIQKNSEKWNQKSVLFVHGIGDQNTGYSRELIDIFSANPEAVEIAKKMRWYELQYDFVNDSMVEKSRGVWDMLGKITPDKYDEFSEEAFSDLLNFFYVKDAKNWIENAYKKVLAEIVEHGQEEDVFQEDHEIYIISHSLGTVVTYEALHGIIDSEPFVISSLLSPQFATLGAWNTFAPTRSSSSPI